jgi:hypothetical protein
MAFKSRFLAQLDHSICQSRSTRRPPANWLKWSPAVRHWVGGAAFLGRAPDTAAPEDLRLFQLHQTQAGVGASGINGSVAALRFFFTVTLDRPEMARHLTFVREPRRIPVVLSLSEGSLTMRPTGHIRAAFAKILGNPVFAGDRQGNGEGPLRYGNGGWYPQGR